VEDIVEHAVRFAVQGQERVGFLAAPHCDASTAIPWDQVSHVHSHTSF
jgi:hypothetical protein